MEAEVTLHWNNFYFIATFYQYLDFRSSVNEPVIMTNPLCRSVRCRGETDLLCVHYDASDVIHCYNTDTNTWGVLADLPHGAGYEYAALAANMSTLYVVGGRSSDGRSLRSVFSYDLGSRTWSRLSDMKEVRWYHGAVIIGTRYDMMMVEILDIKIFFRLYSVLGCTQLDSVEYLELDTSADVADTWQLVSPLLCPRHLPGVGSLDTCIYVCGGSDDNWTAHTTVEMLDTRLDQA